MSEQKRAKRTKKMQWKRLFFGLLILNIIIIMTLTALIFWPVNDDYTYPADEEETGLGSEFTIRTTKENLNELVNAYLDKLLRNTRHQYSVSFEEDVHLVGELPVFSTTVPLSVHLDPVVQDNGDVVLKQKSISVGKLELPNKKIMEYLKKYLPMPKWVQVNPGEEEIYVAITEMDIKSNFGVKLQHIDLEKNNLAFKIRVPYRTLGIDEPDLKEAP